MAKVDEVERYPDGSEIKRFPRYVYPGGKPSTNPANKYEHNGVLVNNPMELEQALIKFGDKQGLEPETKKNKQGW